MCSYFHLQLRTSAESESFKAYHKQCFETVWPAVAVPQSLSYWLASTSTYRPDVRLPSPLYNHQIIIGTKAVT